MVSGLAPSSEEDQGNRDESPPIVILDSPPGSVQIFDHNGPSSVEILDSGRVVSPACMDADSGVAKMQGTEVSGCPEESDIEHPAINNGKMCTAEADLMSEIDELFRSSSLECNEGELFFKLSFLKVFVSEQRRRLFSYVRRRWLLRFFRHRRIPR